MHWNREIHESSRKVYIVKQVGRRVGYVRTTLSDSEEAHAN